MYLERMPRYKNTTPAEVSALSQYFTWVFEKKDPESKAKNYTLKEWCGVDYKSVPTGDVRKFYKQHHKMEYWDWDKEHKYKLDVCDIYTNSDRRWHVHIDNEDCCSLGSGEFDYVHELQNLVRINCKANLPITKEVFDGLDD
jgi:hypothetical protein